MTNGIIHGIVSGLAVFGACMALFIFQVKRIYQMLDDMQRAINEFTHEILTKFNTFTLVMTEKYVSEERYLRERDECRQNCKEKIENLQHEIAEVKKNYEQRLS